MSYTYLTAQQLAEKIQYDARTIRNQLKDSVFIEGVHYIRPFGGRKILFVWERIETALLHKDLKTRISHIYSNLSDNSGVRSA